MPLTKRETNILNVFCFFCFFVVVFFTFRFKVQRQGADMTYMLVTQKKTSSLWAPEVVDGWSLGAVSKF